jgi:hypothetical protein
MQKSDDHNSKQHKLCGPAAHQQATLPENLLKSVAGHLMPLVVSPSHGGQFTSQHSFLHDLPGANHDTAGARRLASTLRAVNEVDWTAK